MLIGLVGRIVGLSKTPLVMMEACGDQITFARID